MSAPLLVELFTEELPPKALKQLGEAFARVLQAELKSDGLLGTDCTTEVFATPRRLAVRLSAVLDTAPDRQFDERLLPEKVGLTADGKPTPALLKKLAGLLQDESAVARIKKVNDGKISMLYLPVAAKGQTLVAGLGVSLHLAVTKLPIPKVMSYQLTFSTDTVKFVRPAHGLVAIHGNTLIEVGVLELDATCVTHGHRFLGSADIKLNHANEYENRLKEEGRVIASFDTRRAEIESQLIAKAAELNATLGDYTALLDEVTALVEWPVVYVAGFDAEFLAVPQECLILTMRTNQKYFPLFAGDGKLTAKFLVVSNMQVADPKNIIEGNERVVRPRLADARFFFEQDRKSKLETRVPQLAKVVYHNKLGSQLDRVERLQQLAGSLAQAIGADVALAKRAAYLAKADLLTGMVGEFPELQGIMGRYYAQHDGESAVVADAIAEHYAPRFAGDVLPQTPEACCVALADKLDTLVGIFGIGQIPTGDKDPFALRRHALGVVRILAERALPLDIATVLKLAHAAFPAGNIIANSDGKALNAALDFVTERARGYLREQGYTPQEVESVLALMPPPREFVPRLAAARAFLALPEAAGLAEADKRIRNILAKSDAVATVEIDSTKFEKDEENQILINSRSLSVEVDGKLKAGDFSAALLTTARLHQPVTAFFDAVMVNAEDMAVRANRFALLREVAALTNRVVNLSKLAQ